MPSVELEERLSNLMAVADVGLTRLDVDDLLSALLDRLREILAADTAAVLLREGKSDALVARAARGLEDEVRQGVRLSIGAGFAGRIAAERRPIVLDRVDQTTVTNPILWRTGIRRMLGVPLQIGDELLGVMHVGRLSERSFEEHDVELMQLAAERVASAVQVRQLAIESAAGAVLERELLPGQLPAVPGLEFAGRYAPAEDRSVGGDWYDVFVLPSGALWLVVGDVAGHGVTSAVVVNRVKSALRSYALLDRPVDEVLTLTNHKLLHFEVDTLVTVCCAVAFPPYEQFRIARAGHPPPVLATPAATTVLGTKPGPPLGAFETTYRASELALPANSTLLFYTDGLIERRGESIAVGIERLRDAVTNSAAEDLCRDVMLSMVGSEPTGDDVAVLAVHRQPETNGSAQAARSRAAAADVQPATGFHDGDVVLAESRFRADQDSVAQARSFVMGHAVELSVEASEALRLLVSEVATNAVMHAHSEFVLRVSRGPDYLQVSCTDFGQGAIHRQSPEADDPHGRGILFISHYSDEWGVDQVTCPDGKQVWFRFRLQPPAAESDGQDHAAERDE